MRHLTIIAVLCAVLASLSGCLMAARHIYRATTTDPAESQLRAALERYQGLVLNTDVSRLADMFEAQGELSRDDQKPQVGHDAIAAALKAQFALAQPVEFELHAASTSVQTGSATQRGSYRQTLHAADGAAIKEEGSFDAQWQHQPDGRWLLRRMHTARGAAGAG